MTQPIPARAPMTTHGVQIPRPAEPGGMFRARLEPQIFRNTPAQIIRTTPSWTPPPRPPAPPQAPQPALAQAAPSQVPAAPSQVPAAPAPAVVPAAASPAQPAPAPAATPLAPATPAETPLDAPPADGGPPLGPEEYAPIPGEMTFRQFLQGLNPLHHLPGVGMIYRAATGAEIHPVMRVLGGGVFGGPIGMITAALGAALESTRPLERLGATWAGRPDPHMPAPGSAAARAAAAYARFGEAS